MASPTNVVRIPKPGSGAYNPNRPLHSNTLIEAQVRHFAEAEKNLPPESQTGIAVDKIVTEGEASAYIRRVTEAIHKSGGRMRKVQATR
jgi:hypothetical protein